MLQVTYDDTHQELIVDGRREDYANFCDSTRRAIASGSEIALPVKSKGRTTVSHFVLRKSAPPNRVSFDGGRVIFSVAPTLQRQFLSFIEFPANDDLPDSPIQYHHHFDGLADDGTHVAPDSLQVIFALERI